MDRSTRNKIFDLCEGNGPLPFHTVIIAPNAASLPQGEQDKGEPPEYYIIHGFTLEASGAAGLFNFEGVDVLLDCFLLVFLDVTGSTSTSPASMSHCSLL